MGIPEEKPDIATRLVFPAAIENTPPFFWVDFMLRSVLVLNLLDGILTLVWVKQGLAEEANLFLRGLVHNNPVAFILVKISLVSICSLVLWKNKKQPFAVQGLFLVFAIYSAIFLYHMHFLIILLFIR